MKLRSTLSNSKNSTEIGKVAITESISLFALIAVSLLHIVPTASNLPKVTLTYTPSKRKINKKLSRRKVTPAQAQLH